MQWKKEKKNLTEHVSSYVKWSSDPNQEGHQGENAIIDENDLRQ